MAAKGKNLGKVTFSRREKLICLVLGLVSPLTVIALVLLLNIITVGNFTLDGVNGLVQKYALNYRSTYTQLDAEDANAKAVNAVKNQLVLLTIDDETLADPRFNKWPIPRTRYAEMLGLLKKAGARVVGIDVLFTEHQDKAADEALARALKDNKAAVLVDAVTSQRGQLQIQEPLPLLTEGWTKDEMKRRIGLTVETENIVSVPLVAMVNGQPRLSFDALLGAIALGVAPEAVEDHSEGWSPRVTMGDRSIPVVDGAMQINYQWPGSLQRVGVKDNSMSEANATHFSVNQIPLVALWDMTDHDLERFFKDKVVLIGVTALAGEDIKTTPLGRMGGVEVHMNALITLLSGQFLFVMSPWSLIVVSLALCLLLGIVLPWLDPRVGSLLTIVLLVVMVGFIPIYMVAHYNLFFPPVLPAASVLIAYSFITVYLVRAERRAKMLMKTLFEKATPVREEDVINFLLSGKTEADQFETQLEVRERTVLFSDIRDYTVMSESMNADMVMKTLNVYYSEMQTVINECGGKIWEYVGDAQMVIFGERTNGRYPPECQVKPEYAEMNPSDQAVHAAINMIARLEQLNAEARGKGMPVLDIGIGINAGPVSLGTIKNKGKLVFAAIGDTTNVAARMQAMSKDLKCRILLSESTFTHCEDIYLSEKVENVKVKGKAEPMTVYRVFAGQQARERENVATSA